MSTIQLNSIAINNSTTCGYCKGLKSGKLWVTSGFYCYKMQLNHYQMLLDRGWRRSGVYYYRPAPNLSCCQAFSIRLDTDEYEPRIAHLKVLKRMKSIYPIEQEQDIEQGQQEQQDITQIIKGKLITDIDISNLQILDKYGQHFTHKGIQLNEQVFALQFQESIKQELIQVDFTQLSQILHVENINFIIQLYQATISEFQAYECAVYKGNPNGIVHQWTFGCNFFSLFYNRAQQKYPQIPPLRYNQPFLEYMTSLLKNSGLTFKICEEDGQILITSDESLKHKKLKAEILFHLQKLCIKPLPQGIKPKYEVEIQWVKAKYQADSFEVYKKYQKLIHNKEIVSKQNYINFICLDALDAANDSELGCWHMKYYLKNQLIAVGVVDMLPESLSSVYFFYDPTYKKYSLGVFGALKEIEFIKSKLNLHYYYMGYYIQDSPKMAYKGEYRKCQLLCPRTYKWTLLTKEIRLQIQRLDLSIDKYDQTDEDMDFKNEDIEQFNQTNVRIQLNGKFYTISQLKKNYAAYFLSLFENLLPLIGRQLMQEFVFQTR